MKEESASDRIKKKIIVSNEESNSSLFIKALSSVVFFTVLGIGLYFERPNIFWGILLFAGGAACAYVITQLKIIPEKIRAAIFYIFVGIAVIGMFLASVLVG